MKNLLKYIVNILVVIFPIISFSQGVDEKSVDSAVVEIFKEYKIAGASVLIAKNDQVIINKGYGYANLEFEVPASKHTKYFTIGVFDIFNAAITFKLQEQNKVQLDDPVTQYIEGLPQTF